MVTLTMPAPSLAHKDGRPYMAFGTPGGDQQEQWQLQFFLRHVHHGLNLQESIDSPMSHTAHFPSSFYPRDRKPGHLAIEDGFGSETIAALRARGHHLDVTPQWTIGRMVAAARDEDGLLRAAATPPLVARRTSRTLGSPSAAIAPLMSSCEQSSTITISRLR